MKSFLDNYESLTPSERFKLCYDLKESLNKAKVILDKLMLDALRSLPTSTGQRIIEIDPDDHFMQFITDIEGDRAELPETSVNIDPPYDLKYLTQEGVNEILEYLDLKKEDK